MHAHPMASMGQAGSRAGSLLASGRGAVAIVAFTGDAALAAGATMETGRPFPGAEDFAAGSVTVTPVEADVASVELDAASVEADMPSVAVDVASAEADGASAEADIASVEADMPSVEAEAVPIVVGAGRLHHQPETLAAGGICCRPLRFGSRGAMHGPYMKEMYAPATQSGTLMWRCAYNRAEKQGGPYVLRSLWRPGHARADLL